MFSFSKKSADALSTCDAKIQLLFNEVIKYVDCTIICGHRSKEDQDKAVAEKKSKTAWPNSKHNQMPSKAVDVVPYPIRWGTEGTTEQRRKDIARFYFFAGYVKSVADSMNIDIRWGGDWDSDLDFSDQSFDDLPHFELRS